MLVVPGGPARFRFRHFIVASVVLVLASVSITGFVWAKKSATMIVDGKRSVVDTQAGDVAGVLKQTRVVYDDNDLVTPALTTRLADDTVIVVRHAIPVTVHTGSETRDVSVVGKTVADALVAVGLDPTVGMDVSPTVNASLHAGMDIVATDVFTRVVQDEAPIGFNTVINSDPNMATGSRKTLQAGAQGRILRIYQVTVTGGLEGTRTLKAEQVTLPPVDEVVVVGSKRPSPPVVIPPALRPATIAPGGWLSAKASTYGIEGGQLVHEHLAGGGVLAREALVVAHKTLPFGTKVEFQYKGRSCVAVVMDRGPYVAGREWDFAPGVCSALHFSGVATVQYRILGR
jgi:uncharacterized protein YabE (DUF348 family)